MAKPASTTLNIVLPKLDIRKVNVRIVGHSPLICHAWSEKAKRQMLDKQMKRAAPKKAAKDPFEDFSDSMYWLSDKPENPTPEDVAAASFGFPTVAFKMAAVGACRHIEGISMILAKGVFHVDGEFVRIETANGMEVEAYDKDAKAGNEPPPAITPDMREDMVRIGMGTADIRYRGQFRDWAVTLPIRYNATVLSLEQVFNLFNTAGFAVGVGEWRPEKNGNFGMFHVATGEQTA